MATEQHMTKAVTQTITEVAETTIMTLTGSDNSVNNARPIHTA